ncbi:MAG: LCP family protein, partial [Chloroflexota bacterium]
SVPRSTVEPRINIPPLNGNKRYNILILGSDNDRKSQESHPLTQSMIVVTIDPVHDQVGLISIPRDFYVKIRGHGMDKIDVAAKYGANLKQGIQLARETVETQFHIPIDFYAWVGLNGFRNVIDTFHGVNVDVAHPVLDDFYPDDQRPGDPYAFTRVFIPAGWRHLSGRQALQYVRSRHGDAIGDFGRSARQQQLLLQIRKKADALTVITNLPSLVNDLQYSVRTDLNLEQLYQLAQLSRHIKSASITKLVLQVPTYATYGHAGAESIVIPNWKAINPVVSRMTAPITIASTHPRSVPAVAPTKAPTPHPTTPVAAPTRAALPNATSTRTAPAVAGRGPVPRVAGKLPGTLVFEMNGNTFELSRRQKLKQITTNTSVSNAEAMPSITTDGKRLALVRYSTSYASDIYLLNVRTQQFIQLTQDASTDVHNNVWAAWPQWSPDGKEILYASDRAKLFSGVPETESRPLDLGIWMAPSAGGTPQQLTVPAQGAGGDTNPQWIPGKNQFLYVHWMYNQANQAVSQLVVRDTADSGSWTVTGVNGRVLQPQVNRAGNRVVYVRGSGSSSEIVQSALHYRAGVPSLGPPVVVARGEVAQPAFTPHGKWISYLQVDGNGFSLYLVSTQGGRAARLSSVGSQFDSLSRPVWIK